jgi:malto-oligosyltrehalose trehalohydrolase
MPFGADVREDGSVRFRLWAPAAKTVAVVIAERRVETLAMAAGKDGWFELETNAARGLSRYSFLIDNQTRVPDPVSRFQPQDVHGPSQVIDPRSFRWTDDDWRGRPFQEAIIYELHVGAFSASGLYSGVQERLDYLVDLGVTAIELMPLSDFAGKRNWGYDGVLPYAPDSSYGRPEELKALINAAHNKGLMMFLDVVYNHFGPEGNYLRAYAPQFFTDRHQTPWGEGINFDGDQSRTVRDYFIHNSLYWLTEYNFDGLRFDAVNAILDDSKPDILVELAETVRQRISAERQVHLILENEKNQAKYLRRRTTNRPVHFDAQWNDDIHHAMHALITGEADGYYTDYAEKPVHYLGRCLTEGFGFQNDPSKYREGERRGEPSADLPPTAFVSFLQNHDQIGNRAVGDRIDNCAKPEAIRAMTAIFLLAPQPPLLFMGEEFAASTPFLFFCDFTKDLAKAVTEGRRNEFSKFERFKNPDARLHIPDPNDIITFERSTLDWASLDDDYYLDWLKLHRRLLQLRKEHVVPFLTDSETIRSNYKLSGDCSLTVEWKSATATLRLFANLSDSVASAVPLPGKILYSTSDQSELRPPWSVAWSIQS